MQKRVFKYLVLLSLLVLFLSTIASLFIYYDRYTETVKEELFKLGNILQVSMEESRDELQFLEDISKKNKTFRITYIDPDGDVLFDTAENPKFLPKHDDRPEIKDAKKFGFADYVRFSQTLGKNSYYVSFLLHDDYVLRISKETDSILGSFVRIFPAILLIAFVIFLIGLMVARKFTHITLSPINDLNEDLTNVDTDKFPEISPFINRISNQNQIIQESLKQIQREKDTIETILSNMKEALIIVDENKTFLSVNKSALKFFGGSENVIGKNILFLIRNEKILNLLNKALNGQNSHEIIDIENRNFKVYVNPVLEDGRVKGVVMLFIDETNELRALKLRDEFSSNVSHELKTPLTSICGFSELLAKGMVNDDKSRQEFNELIYRDSKRLLNLIEDIMKISGIDKLETDSREKIDLRFLMEQILKSEEGNILAKKLTTNVIGQANIFENKTMIWELFSNLISNGVKYNKDKGQLDINISENDKYIFVDVSDTGIGIPNSEIERIFERFYRVDKSRSKKIEGTGLGLSIVKHILSNLDGEIEIKSKPGLGSKFTVKLLKNRKDKNWF